MNTILLFNTPREAIGAFLWDTNTPATVPRLPFPTAMVLCVRVSYHAFHWAFGPFGLSFDAFTANAAPATGALNPTTGALAA